MGVFRRRSDKRWVQRYRCGGCRRSFSSATFDVCYRQKKRQFNRPIFELLASTVSQRRCAYLLRLNRKTIKRKFLFLGRQVLVKLWRHNLSLPPACEIEFDDLETFEHTKCKPLSVTLAVECHSMRILGFGVASMPANGPLARKAMKRYGPRADDRSKSRKLLLATLKGLTSTQELIIKSDQNPHYVEDVKHFFKDVPHIRFKSRRGSSTGQGELKKVGFDPLFSLNHTCAKLRADMNRLLRRTWSTTKSIEGLRMHLAIVSLYHNQALLARRRV
jgi:hypothetical protein